MSTTPAAPAADWLTLAPRPFALPLGKKWHVFLSYRSVNRRWVLHLYDILRQLGYEVFLDQYALSAAASLVLSLGEALGSSASAVMIWSSAFEDSEWCLSEYATLESKEKAKTGFRYVIAKLDASPLPELAGNKIWVDFSDAREGPSGVGLLRILYGLTNTPLSDAAVKLASQVDSDVRAALDKINAAREAGDATQLQALAQNNSLAWTSMPLLRCRVADALIALGKKNADAALAILDSVQAQFPQAVRPKQLRGLALARKGSWPEAQLLLAELYKSGEIDPETLGIYARTWMDRYQAPGGSRLHLLKSRDLYRQAFEAAPRDYYTGINAASKSLILGEKETAAQLAARVQEIVGTKAVDGDYWKTATVGEVQLLQRNYAEAAALYQAAVVMAPEERGSHESTYGQARSLLDALAATPEERKQIDDVFAHLATG